jgi:hypothetical protein
VHQLGKLQINLQAPGGKCRRVNSRPPAPNCFVDHLAAIEHLLHLDDKTKMGDVENRPGQRLEGDAEDDDEELDEAASSRISSVMHQTLIPLLFSGLQGC